jgi:HD-like signal output (HDOD) protein
MIAELNPVSGSGVTPEDIVRAVKDLPCAPKVLPRLKRLLGDANSSLDDVVALIRLDPGIAARVLQVGNSAYYSQGIRCGSIEAAVQRVGFAEVYDLVAYAVASQVIVRPLAVYRTEADEMWKSAVACALAAENLALRTGEDVRVAYTVGLLHGLGMVAIDAWSRVNAPTLSLGSCGLPREATEAERGYFGFTHAEVGSALLRDWEFAPVMTDPVRWQYAPRASVGHVRMASLLLAAKWLRSAVCAGPRGEVPPLPEYGHLQPLGLNPAVLPAMIPDVALRLEEVGSLLDIAMPDVVPVGRHRFPVPPGRAA